jgi:hypothetical protein
MLTFSLLLCLAVLAGYTEYIVMSNGFKSPTPRVLNGIASLKYHIPLWLAWGITCFLAGHLWAIFIFAIVQDMSWYIFNTKESLSEDDWVTMGFGGFYLPWSLQFIPWTYPLLICLSSILFLLM